MKTTMAKIFALVLALAVALSMLAGCSAVNPNPIVMKVGDIEIGVNSYYSLYSNYKSFYSYYGMYNVSTAEDYRVFQDMIFDMLAESYLPAYWAEQNGVKLSDEDKAEIAATLQEQIDSNLASYASSIDESITDEAAIAAEEMRLFKKDLKDGNWTYEKYIANLEDGIRTEFLANKYLNMLYDEEVSITEEDMLEYYREKVQEQTAAYAEDPAQYYQDYNTYQSSGGLMPLVAPEGYRYCKHILIANAAEGEEKDVDAIVAEVKDKLAAGEDFDALVAEYGEDPGMQQEPYMSNGYLMSDAIIDQYYEGFGAAAMALENVGDVSEPVETEGGYHFIQYTSDVSTETVTYGTVSATIESVMDSEAKAEVRNRYITEWTEKTEIVKYYDRVENIK